MKDRAETVHPSLAPPAQQASEHFESEHAETSQLPPHGKARTCFQSIDLAVARPRGNTRRRFQLLRSRTSGSGEEREGTQGGAQVAAHQLAQLLVEPRDARRAHARCHASDTARKRPPSLRYEASLATARPRGCTDRRKCNVLKRTLKKIVSRLVFFFSAIGSRLRALVYGGG